jgi:four helix bundle protein
MSTIKSYRELIVWQRSLDLVEAVYRLTQVLPASERFGLAGQLRRAAVSIPSNIAEGQSRNSTGEFLQALGVARGSLAEVETQLLIMGRLGYLAEEPLQVVLAECAEIGRMLNGLTRSLRSLR